jgi:hypothetical protein
VSDDFGVDEPRELFGDGARPVVLTVDGRHQVGGVVGHDHVVQDEPAA